MNSILRSYYFWTSTLVLMAGLVSILITAKQGRQAWYRSGQAGVKKITYLLKEIQRISRAQYASTHLLLSALLKTKNNVPENFMATLCLPSCISDPTALLSLYKFTTKNSSAHAKVASKLWSLRDTLQYRYSSLHDYLPYYQTQIKLNENSYYENMTELGRMHDELHQYMSNKNFDKTNGADWYEGYFSIFGAWFRSSAGKDIETTYNDIVLKIIALNKLYRFVPFVIQTTTCSLNCVTAYNNIVTLNDTLESQILKYGQSCRLTYKIARLMLQPITPPSLPLNNTTMDIQSVPESISEQPSIKNSFTKGNYSVYAWCAITLIVILTAAWWFYSIRSHPSMTDQHNTKDILSAQTGLPDTPSANSTVVVEDASISPDTLHMIADFKVLFDSNATAAPSVYGIDISKYQGTLLRDLESLDTLHFVICKATEGIKETDLDFKLNWPLIKQKGLIRGAYHFFHSEDPPIQQAQLYLKTIVGLQSTDMPPIVDIEETSIKTRITPYRLDSSLLIFLRYVLEKTGRRPIIYCDVAFANKYLLDESLASYPLWIAEYSKKPIPAIPDLWKNRGYVIWQRSSSYDIDARSTDFDVFNGNGKAFAKFITTH